MEPEYLKILWIKTKMFLPMIRNFGACGIPHEQAEYKNMELHLPLFMVKPNSKSML
jgi:hypothetical protein